MWSKIPDKTVRQRGQVTAVTEIKREKLDIKRMDNKRYREEKESFRANRG